jgi:hypothetical protein
VARNEIWRNLVKLKTDFSTFRKVGCRQVVFAALGLGKGKIAITFSSELADFQLTTRVISISMNGNFTDWDNKAVF